MPGRLMGESILLLQLLPHALQAQEGREGSTEGVTAFLDSAKAYDILVGDFLFEAMRVGAALQPPRGGPRGGKRGIPSGMAPRERAKAPNQRVWWGGPVTSLGAPAQQQCQMGTRRPLLVGSRG